MSRESHLTAGVLLILMPTVVYGGASILSMLVGDPEFAQNEFKQDLWRPDTPTLACCSRHL
jgi:hypothetical protein